mmetsp:Transcript_36058/g.94982  ORF Transcript_36058/g.94982 Transcript_36058/m.94982 type:complete len:667 (-) Transcript_36058:208-2208(-)
MLIVLTHRFLFSSALSALQICLIPIHLPALGAVRSQDAPTLRAAISAYGPILKEANASAHSDLQVAIRYLAQLDAAAAAFASEYNSAVADLHTLTHADVTQVKAEATLARLKVAAERAAAVGAPEEMMGAAQVRANALHTSHVELLHARSRAEVALLDAARVTHTIGNVPSIDLVTSCPHLHARSRCPGLPPTQTIKGPLACASLLGIAGVESLRSALAHAHSLELQSEVTTQAQATLNALLESEQRRTLELSEATKVLQAETERAKAALASAADVGAILRDFACGTALRTALKRAISAGCEQQIICDAQHNLVPLEAAERAHDAEVRGTSEALHHALAEDDEDALNMWVRKALPIREFISAELYDAAEKRMLEFEVARHTARAKTALETALACVDGPNGVEGLRDALAGADAVGLQGLLVRKAIQTLKENDEARDFAQREADALAYLEQAEAAKRDIAERKRREGDAKEKEKESRRERKEAERAARKAEETQCGDDLLAKAVAAQSWDVHTAPDGRQYYHNPVTNTTQWDAPDDVRFAQQRDASRSVEVCSPNLARASSAKNMGVALVAAQFSSKLQHAAAITKTTESDGALDDPATMTVKQLRKFCASRNVEIPVGADTESVRRLALVSKHLPIVAWQRTKAPDGRYYYYNPKTKQTSWSNPET